jgi:hypothetical protein
MMRDVLDMVNFVVDSHSMSDALDTYDTMFRSSGVDRAALSTHPGATSSMTPPIQNPGCQIPKDRQAHCCSRFSRTGL